MEVLLEDGEKKHTDQAAETKEAVESTDASEIKDGAEFEPVGS